MGSVSFEVKFPDGLRCEGSAGLMSDANEQRPSAHSNTLSASRQKLEVDRKSPKDNKEVSLREEKYKISTRCLRIGNSAIGVRFYIASLSACLLLGFAVRIVRGQTPQPSVTPSAGTATPTPDGAIDDDPKKVDKPKKPKRGSLIIAPIPISSPAFGSGLVLGVGYVFRLSLRDKTSPPSTIGIAAAFTNSGTRGAAVGGRLNFGENKYRTTFAFGKGRANYTFFGIGRIPGREPLSVEIRQAGAIFFGEFLRNIGKNTFVGPRYQYRKFNISLGGLPTIGGFEIPPIDIKSTTAALGFRVQRDTTGGSFYPRKGAIFNFTGDFFTQALGSNRTYQTYKTSYNGYKSVGKKQVVAYRATACSVSDRAPFFDLCSYGSSSDLRGYTTGEFQNRRMFATQAEFRQELPFRLGIVGFGGIGGVERRWNEFRFDRLLPAAGVGLRFKLDKTNHINYRIDLGFGRTGRTLSMSVSEAF